MGTRTSANVTFWQCSTLHDACLTLFEPQRDCSRDCRNRSFRIDVYGPHATEDVSRVLTERRLLRDPIQGFNLRHLEQDIFASSASGPPPQARRASSIHLVWPRM